MSRFEPRRRPSCRWNGPLVGGCRDVPRDCYAELDLTPLEPGPLPAGDECSVLATARSGGSRPRSWGAVPCRRGDGQGLPGDRVADRTIVGARSVMWVGGSPTRMGPDGSPNLRFGSCSSMITRSCGTDQGDARSPGRHRRHREAGTVRDAIDEAERTRPDVIVMDVRLADGSGIEATREIRAANPETAS